MSQETKTCQNCKQAFTIEPEDFDFYEKIKVPVPTFCPECRAKRRMVWRNERTLYRRKCDATQKNIISVFSEESPYVVYEHDYWWSDKWDQLASGQSYDFSKSFFMQFQELLKKSPLPNLANSNMVNSDYGNHNANCKNCYLLFASFEDENVSYSRGVLNSKDSMDLFIVEHGEMCYEDVMCMNVYRVSFSKNTSDSHNSMFLQACRNCNDCIGCTNLRNKSYHIFNKPYAKEEYLKRLNEFDFGSYEKLKNFQKKWQGFIMQYPRKSSVNLLKCVNVIGDNIVQSKNCKFCFDGFGGLENCKFVVHAVNLKDSYDCYGAGVAELLYEGVDVGISASSYKFTGFVHRSHNIQYFYSCHSSSNLFGCIGLRNKSYCILNKQYTKEEYEELVPKIIEHMNTMPYVSKIPNDKIQMSNQVQNPNVKTQEIIYRYGEFFPPELSPFCYNETIAQEYFPLTKDEAIAQGYKWKDREERNYEIDITTDQLPDHIKDVQDDIIGQVIECVNAKCQNPNVKSMSNVKGQMSNVSQCTTAFKIIEPELQFYRRMNLPLPRLCPNCRHYERLKQRNPLKLWHRKCQCAGLKSEARLARRSVSEAGEGGSTKSETFSYTNTIPHAHGTNPCPNEFETSYAPDRSEIVYCEECYKREVV